MLTWNIGVFFLLLIIYSDNKIVYKINQMSVFWNIHNIFLFNINMNNFFILDMKIISLSLTNFHLIYFQFLKNLFKFELENINIHI